MDKRLDKSYARRAFEVEEAELSITDRDEDELVEVRVHSIKEPFSLNDIPEYFVFTYYHPKSGSISFHSDKKDLPQMWFEDEDNFDTQI